MNLRQQQSELARLVQVTEQQLIQTQSEQDKQHSSGSRSGGSIIDHEEVMQVLVMRMNAYARQIAEVI